MESANEQHLTSPRALYQVEVPINAQCQIRILEVLPGEYDDKHIQCRLYAADLRDAVFEALSYTWGQSTQGWTIQLNSIKAFATTDNLFFALQRLRHRNQRRFIWVDALCINQQDLNERAQQVRLMGELYKRADRVVVWLGDTTEPLHVQESPFRPQNFGDAMTLHTSVPDEYEDRMMRALDTAIATTRPQYWKRTWTIQELVLALDLIVQFGAFEMSWVEVGTLRERMSSMMELSLSQVHADDITRFLGADCPEHGSFGHYVRQYRLSDFDDGYEALNTLRTYKDTWSGLAEIASSTPRNQATDLRDRVYGYYGLWSGQHIGCLEVDYGKSIGQVFTEATYADMTAEKNLRILNLVRPAAANHLNMPTWALDFSFLDLDTHVPVYPQCVLRSVPENSYLMFETRLLKCQGHIIDSVGEVHQLPSSMLYPKKGEETLLHSIESAIPICDAYANLRKSQGLTVGSGMLANRPNLGLRTSLPAEAESLTFELGSSTDPISNIFLWWMSKFHRSLPSRLEFNELYEWWRYYNKYAASTTSRECRDVYFITDCGFLGRALNGLASGDLIVFLQGLELPVVLSQHEEGYLFKGLAWVNGAMLGELDDIILRRENLLDLVLK